MPDLNYAAIPGIIRSENVIPMFQDERMFFQLESPNARLGCDNSRLPKVHLSMGLNGMNMMSSSMLKVEGGGSNILNGQEQELSEGSEIQRVGENDDPLIRAFRRGVSNS